jgi:hypothetical protein
MSTFFVEVLDTYESLDLSTCVNVNTVQVGVLVLEEDEDLLLTMSTMWKILSSLPYSDRVEVVELTFTPHQEFSGIGRPKLEVFPWIEAIQRVQEMFKLVKKIIIRIGTWYRLPQEEIIEAMEDLGLYYLIESDLVDIQMYIWPDSTTTGMPFVSAL